MQPCLSIACLCALGLSLTGLSSPAPAQVTPYGTGINPANSLALTAGVPQTGASFQLSVKNTAATNPLPGQAYLYLASQPTPGFPAGLVLPGLGLGGPGSNGELLLDLLPPNPFLTLGPSSYPGGTSTGASFLLSVPPNPALVGFSVFAQGLLVTVNLGIELGLTNALQITLGAPTGPVPGVTPIPGLAVIQPGTFQMGSDAAAGAPYAGSFEEQPVHAVTISSAFWMGITEVTQAQYQALMIGNPSLYVGPDNPVERVSWFDTQAYCTLLTAQQSALGNVPAGYQYRLPTEAEWEYACRAGTTTEFNTGTALFCNQAKFGYSNHSNSFCSFGNTVPVGSYPANAWGLHDMHGNVLEWCLDDYATYSAGAVTDPYVSGGSSRVFRGGSWGSFSSDCRSAYRASSSPEGKGQALGFRVVLAPILVP